MRVNLEKKLDKDVFHAIKTAIGCPTKSAWNKIRYVSFCKLGQITKKLIIWGQVVPPIDIKLK